MLGIPFSLAAIALVLSACSVVSPEHSPDSLRANAEVIKTIHLGMSPAAACPRLARMMSWCATGPNYHYRCAIVDDNSRAVLTGTLEAVFHAEIFLVTDFVRDEGGTTATIYQHKGMMIPNFPELVETRLNDRECRPE
ncbi:hypothetical protein [Magnetospirillum molischianum]|uniref:Lipoprotein n=1 Tax=Magnetospirillum molischianum DSM 120 TaxID=1150626 RepID=H8FN49_MAGML|nr:hypothetical protein [Magnetospirillum molischianum]CCG39787.1 conserved exported hypothetical protein [Magnetospirillum molischianum DSM 120]